MNAFTVYSLPKINNKLTKYKPNGIHIVAPLVVRIRFLLIGHVFVVVSINSYKKVSKSYHNYIPILHIEFFSHHVNVPKL